MKIPEPINTLTTASAIKKMYEAKEQYSRPHLGASEIGKECDRALWYSFRWATKKKFDGRMLRLFDTGFRAEARFIEELKAIGVEFHEKDPETGKQISFQAHGGHFAGSCDGMGKGFPEAPKSWAVSEFKTHGDKSFTALSKDRVQKAKPEHYAQMQIYMGLSEVDRALYLAVNKNTDELYSEWIHFDAVYFSELMNRAENIIFALEPPQKISEDPAWFKCKFCDHHDTCQKKIIPEKNCRTCSFSTPLASGGWNCELQKRKLSISDQREGCRSHLFIPPLIQFATPLDYQEGYVLYECKNGVAFGNVSEENKKKAESTTETLKYAYYTSEELQGNPESIISSPIIDTMKREFGGKLTTTKVGE